MILYSGRQFMKQIGLDLFFTEQNIKWYESQMPFHPIDHFKNMQATRAILNSEPFSIRQLEGILDSYALLQPCYEF